MTRAEVFDVNLTLVTLTDVEIAAALFACSFRKVANFEPSWSSVSFFAAGVVPLKNVVQFVSIVFIVVVVLTEPVDAPTAPGTATPMAMAPTATSDPSARSERVRPPLELGLLINLTPGATPKGGVARRKAHETMLVPVCRRTAGPVGRGWRENDTSQRSGTRSGPVPGEFRPATLMRRRETVPLNSASSGCRAAHVPVPADGRERPMIQPQSGSTGIRPVHAFVVVGTLVVAAVVAFAALHFIVGLLWFFVKLIVVFALVFFVARMVLRHARR